MAKARQDTHHGKAGDATRDLVLVITSNDIADAKPAEIDACPAAKALCRQEHFRQARVYRTRTYVQRKDGSWLRFITPDDLYTEIIVFDRGGRMKGGEFKLAAPKGGQRLGQHRKPTGRKTRTGRKLSPHIVENVRDIAPKGRGHLKALFE